MMNTLNLNFPFFSSSSNNIQDHCLIITDIYGVREKGGVSIHVVLLSAACTVSC